MATPEIINADSFATAIPSNLFDETVRIRSAMIIPCRVAPADSNKMSAGERAVSLKTGSRIAAARNAAAAGMPNRAQM